MTVVRLAGPFPKVDHRKKLFFGFFHFCSIKISIEQLSVYSKIFLKVVTKECRHTSSNWPKLYILCSSATYQQRIYNADQLIQGTNGSSNTDTVHPGFTSVCLNTAHHRRPPQTNVKLPQTTVFALIFTTDHSKLISYMPSLLPPKTSAYLSETRRPQQTIPPQSLGLPCNLRTLSYLPQWCFSGPKQNSWCVPY